MTTKRIPKKPEERRVWIKRQLEDAGSSFADIGRDLQVSRQAVRKGASWRIRQAVASKLGLPHEVIYPEHGQRAV